MTAAPADGVLRPAARGLVAVYLVLLTAQDALAVLGLLSLGLLEGEGVWLGYWLVRAAAEAALVVALARRAPRAEAAAGTWLVLSAGLHVASALRNPLGFRTGRLALHVLAVALLAVAARRRRVSGP